MTNPDRLTLEALKAHTARAHVRAEKSGVVADLLRRRASAEAFTLFLRNLVPAYAALEEAIESRASAPPIAFIRFPEVERRAALEGDVAHMAGPDWRNLPLTPAAQDYAARIRHVAARQPELLIAHAYVRYFGDLNGGQILRRMIGEALNLPADALRFYDFTGIADMPAFIAQYRAAFERALDNVADPQAVLAEADSAFAFNIAVSNETQAFARELPAA